MIETVLALIAGMVLAVWLGQVIWLGLVLVWACLVRGADREDER
jgi:hypothetical protein